MMSLAALPVLRTPRLVLRPLDPKDAPAIARAVGNYDVSKWLSVVPYPYTLEDAAWFIEKSLSDNARVWAICDEDGLQGCAGLDPEMGYWLARTAWRKGYGFEAAHALVSHWFSDPGAGDLASGFFHGNERSGAVLKALGFVETGQVLREARALAQEVTATRVVLTRAGWEARQRADLHTARLHLRPLVEADAPALIGIATPAVARGVASIPSPWDEADALDFIAKRQWRGLTGFMLAIEHGGRIVGCVGCGGAPLSVMFFIEKTHWNKGFATEAMRAFLPDLFRKFPVSRIEADHFEDIPASGVVLEKLGFRRTGSAMGHSKARLEPAPVITYAVRRDTFGTVS